MRIHLLAATAALAGLVGASVTPALAGPAAETPASTAYHLYRPNAPAMQASSPPANPTMLYFGGPVIAKVKVVIVLWGSGVPKSTTSRIKPFFKAITNSTFVDQLAQYSTVGITGVNGDPGTNQTIVRGSLGGKFQITPMNTSKNLTDADVQTELKAQIAAGALPAANLNTLYMTYFPANISISIGGAKSCVSFGAYHEAVSSTVTKSNLFYGVMPDCNGGFASITVASSHEFAEAITDAIPTPGTHPAYPQAWNDANGNEIGDLCEGHDTTLTAGGQVYTVQEVFTNSTNACATGKFTSP
jgi:hypothetical protein